MTRKLLFDFTNHESILLNELSCFSTLVIVIIFYDSSLLIISALEAKKNVCLHQDCKFPPNRKSLTKTTLMMDVSLLFTLVGCSKH